jgi:hypothetical protein
MKTTTTQQMIEGNLPTDADVLAAMRQYKVEFAASAPPAWIGEWFGAAWRLLRSRGWTVARLGAELA